MNATIVRMQFGSHVYGTNIPTSDHDYKSIFIPDATDLILQRATKHIDKSTKTDSSARNLPSDIDDEAFSVSEFLRLLLEGQTVALDMIFAPARFVQEASREWHDIVNLREHFLHKGTSSFVGYTRTQAAKYGVKGFRVAALRLVLNWLNGLEREEFKLKDYEVSLHDFIHDTNNENIKIVSCKGPNGIYSDHLEVCNRKVPLHARVKYAKDVFQRIFDEYGHRAMLAEKNEGIDWKALMHAVRVAREAEELLLTGFITFPRPEKELLLQIRKGEMSYKAVAEIIEEGLITIDDAQKKSTLPESPDYKLAEQLIYSFHRDAIAVEISTKL